MGAYNVINRASMAAGQAEDVSQVLANFDAIATVLNGGIDNSNVNAAAALALSKLAGYPADGTKFAAGDGTWKAIAAASGATVATTIAGLGAGVDGKIGYLRVGSGQFRLMTMIYDGSLAKWVSQERLAHVSISPTQNESPVSATMYPKYGVAFHKWADYIAAGLHPQYRVFGMTNAQTVVATWTIGYTFAHASLDNYPTSTPQDLTRIGPDICIGNPTVAGTPLTAYTGGENSSLDWVDCPTPGSPKALGGAVWYCQGNSANGGWAMNLWERWVG